MLTLLFGTFSLWKIAASFPDTFIRAYTALNEACEIAKEALISEPLDYLRKILFTLSPTNTKIYLPLRRQLLWMIAQWAIKFWGHRHPIATICNSLVQEGNTPELSRRALHCLYDLSTAQLGASHAISHKLMGSVITLTRRSGELYMAKQLSEEAFELAKLEHGFTSNQARSAARELAHNLALLGDHLRAFELRMYVIQEGCARKSTSPYHQDENAVWAMEDIAERCVETKMLSEAIYWLQQAECIALRIWGDTVSTRHITDKLNNALKDLWAADT